MSKKEIDRLRMRETSEKRRRIRTEPNKTKRGRATKKKFDARITQLQNLDVICVVWRTTLFTDTNEMLNYPIYTVF